MYNVEENRAENVLLYELGNKVKRFLKGYYFLETAGPRELFIVVYLSCVLL